jgi:hypothetical protein
MSSKALYVTRFPLASTHQKYVWGGKPQGGADTAEANCPKSWAILYRWEEGIKMKKG